MHTARVWAAAAALAVVVALACTGCAAADDTYTIVGYLQLPPNAPRDASLPTTKISVNGGEFSTVTRRDGSFKVNDVPPGKHLVEALSLDYVYPQVRLQISSEGKFQVFEYKMPGSAREKGSYPLSLKPVMGASYFQVRQGVDFMSFFKNPMMLMMLFSMVMIGVLPKMMKNMDPDAMKQFQEMQAKAAGDEESSDDEPAPRVEDAAQARRLASSGAGSGSGGGGARRDKRRR